MDRLKTTILSAAILTMTAEAHAEPVKRVAPEEVYRVAPGLGNYTDRVLFGDVWQREGLSRRDRSLVVLSALISSGKAPQARSHMRLGLDNGLTPTEISEIITHLAFYSGWPNAISAVMEANEVFDERGIGQIELSDQPPIELDAKSEASRKAAVDRIARPVTPELANDTDNVLFNDLWRRPELSPRDRSLVTMASLIANGQAEQLPFHLNKAMDNGLTREEAGQVVSHLAYYVGWPKGFSAVGVLADVFAQRSANSQTDSEASTATALSVTRFSQDDVIVGNPKTFTGDVTVSSYSSADIPGRNSSGVVKFEAGARTAWHTHPLGQTLIISEGCGWVQSDGDDVQVVRPGDVVWIPANVRHWHGASNDKHMTHFAVAQALNGSAVTWMEHVTDDQYATGNQIEEGCS